MLIFVCVEANVDEEDSDEEEDDEELVEANMNYVRNGVDTNTVETIPAKEPKYNAFPTKSALKKKHQPPIPGSVSSESSQVGVQENNTKSLIAKHEQHSR